MSEPEKEEKEDDSHPYRRPKDAATLILVDRSGSVPKVLVGKRLPVTGSRSFHVMHKESKQPSV